MDVVQLRQIFDWLAPTSICELELRSEHTHLRLRRDAATADHAIMPSAPGKAPEIMTPVAMPEDARPLVGVVAKAPCVGIFLHRHPLRDVDLAPAGTAVSVGQVIGLLQVGALLMPLEAPAAGFVVEHLLKHGSIAGYGTALTSLQPC